MRQPLFNLRVAPEDRAKTRAAAKLAGITESELWRSATLDMAVSIIRHGGYQAVSRS